MSMDYRLAEASALSRYEKGVRPMTGKTRQLAIQACGLLTLATLGLGWVSAAVAAPPEAAPSAASEQGGPLTGHYYLSGIREVGSELLLKPDGRFGWMLAYGSVDQNASGTWRVEGSTVILTADRPDSNRPLANLGPFTPWDIGAENAVRRRVLENAQVDVAMKCPFLAGANGVASTAPPYLDDAEREAAKADAAKSIVAATQREFSSRTHLESAATTAMSATTDRNGAMATANRALEAWQTAEAELSDLYDRADLMRPARVSPRLPSACIMPALVEADGNDAASWTPGLGVRIRFADEELSAGPMAVIFHITDGADVRVTSDRDGYAFVPADRARAWKRTSLEIPTENGMKSVTMAAAPQPKGIQTIILDDKALTSAPFETMRLTIDGRRLLPEGMLARGAYSREP